MTSKRIAKPCSDPDQAKESEAYLASLRRHARVIEGQDRAASALPPGVTHVLVLQKDGAQKLVEKRKSFF